MIKYAVIFWAIAGITILIISKPHNILIGLLMAVMITGFGTVFTNILYEDFLKIFWSFGKEEKEKNDNNLKIIPLSILKMVGVFLLITGMGSFINGFLCATGLTPWITEKTEIPLTIPGSYTMDKDGKLYCSFNFYCRIQQYDSSGNFLRGWFINSGGGSLYMKTDEKNRLIVANVKGHNLLTYDSEGKIIKEEKLEGKEHEKWNPKDENCEIIIKIVQSKIPPYLYFIIGPQCFLIGFTGLVTTGIIDNRIQKIKR